MTLNVDSRVQVILLALLSVVGARVLAAVLPSVPSAGLSTALQPEISILSVNSVYTSDLLINLITIVQYEAYAIIAIATVSTVLSARIKESSSFDFDSVGPSSGQMRNGYLIYTFLIGIPCLPFVVVGVYGIDLLGATLVPPVLSPNLSQNFAVLSAPIFLLALLISVITVELSRQYRVDDA